MPKPVPDPSAGQLPMDVGGERLEPRGFPPAAEPDTGDAIQPPPAAIAWRLASALDAAKSDLIYVATSERRAEETATALLAFAPDCDVLVLPPWDCLPYDRAAPSSDSMGRRMAVLQRLLEPSDRQRLLVTSADAVVQRLPPQAVVDGQHFSVTAGEPFDRQAFEAFAARTGYFVDDRVDEPGEIALRGNVVEVFVPGAELPVRITDSEGVTQAIMRYDPRTQRTLDELQTLTIRPASELIADGEARLDGNEHRLAETYGDLATLLDYLPDAKIVLGPQAEARIDAIFALIDEAYTTACDFGGQPRPRPPLELYLDAAEWKKAVPKKRQVILDLDGIEAAPLLWAEANPAKALAKCVADAASAGERLVLCSTPAEQRQIEQLLRRAKVAKPEQLETVARLLDPAGPAIGIADLDIAAGFRDRTAKLTVLAAADLLGSRLVQHDPSDLQTALLTPSELRVGDVVVHEDHGVGILRDLTRISVGEIEQDTVRLEYHGGTTLMVPVQDFGRLWRYGAEAEAVSLDRLNSDQWAKKRAQVSAEIDAAAAGLAALAAERLAETASPLAPPKAEYRRLCERFPFPETPDQAAAIEAVLGDLASGRRMNRLVCGDVGFGKTEIALRAATAAALAGRQVALVAPTTVLARQHLASFERRFAGTKITIGQLSRLNTAAEAAEVKDGLRSGDVRIVIATHAIVADDVELPELGLVIIDEEQRFGAQLKRQLQELARGVHLLSMSATPIPRTLQSAMVGLQDVSIIATPPARRRPIRTLVAPFDEASARTALLRERRRSGQSFVVVPRIEDIAAVSDILARIVPELTLLTAHGDMPAKDIDGTLMQFANGEGDVLLATNIIESGLDVPRANTMLVWRADRFGLSQLHQLRGRVGRGRSQGIAYLFTEPDAELVASTRARLSTLEAFDRLGSGFAISARDLELRGAGDLLGEEQAGHVHLIGSGLYQQLLEQALLQAKGEPRALAAATELNLGDTGHIPLEYVPEPVVRINLYARLQRLPNVEAVDDLAEELEDRFGERPDAVDRLLATTRLRVLAARLGIGKIEAGPLAVALTLPKAKDHVPLLDLPGAPFALKGERLIAKVDGDKDPVAMLTELLGSLA